MIYMRLDKGVSAPPPPGKELGHVFQIKGPIFVFGEPLWCEEEHPTSDASVPQSYASPGLIYTEN